MSERRDRLRLALQVLQVWTSKTAAASEYLVTGKGWCLGPMGMRQDLRTSLEEQIRLVEYAATGNAPEHLAPLVALYCTDMDGDLACALDRCGSSAAACLAAFGDLGRDIHERAYGQGSNKASVAAAAVMKDILRVRQLIEKELNPPVTATVTELPRPSTH